MLSSVKLTDKSDIVNFIIFKRRLRAQLRKVFYILLVIFFLSIIAVSLYNADKISSFYKKTKDCIVFVIDKIFEINTSKVRVKIDNHSIISDDEITNIVERLSGKTLSRDKIKNIIEDITNKNSLIENIYIRRNFSNNEINVYIKEKKILAIFIPEDCSIEEKECKKHLITIENKIIPYHKIRNNNDIIRIYGYFGNNDLFKIIKMLKKHNLFEKILYMKFYTSGRFDIMLKNKLIIKLPRRNWENALIRFMKLDNEYILSSDIQNIKYIDLRLDDKAFVGDK